MSTKRGLGRGLGALLGEPNAPAPATPAVAEPAAPPSAYRQIPVAAISPNPYQPRTTFDTAAIEELRSSVVEFGVLVPIIVRERPGDRYELIAGERRWRAASLAQLATIPAIVRDAGEQESLEVAIIENLQRENLDPLEEAMGFAHLMERYGFTQERVAERVGRSRPSVANALRLLHLSDSIKALVRSGALSAGHARALLAVPAERREALARRAAADGLSVRALERLGAPPVAKRRRAASASADDDAVADRLRYRFATPVAIVGGERGGTIEIRYADNAEFIRIVDLLLGESPT